MNTPSVPCSMGAFSGTILRRDTILGGENLAVGLKIFSLNE